MSLAKEDLYRDLTFSRCLPPGNILAVLFIPVFDQILEGSSICFEGFGQAPCYNAVEYLGCMFMV